MRSRNLILLGIAIVAAALSPIVMFIRVGNVLGGGNKVVAYTGTEALINVIVVALTGIAIGMAFLYIGRRMHTLSIRNAALEQETDGLEQENGNLKSELGDLHEQVQSLYRLSIDGGNVFRGREQVPLSSDYQLKLLQLLFDRGGEVCTTDEILKELYGSPDSSNEGALRQLIYRLRQNINSIHDYISTNENRQGYSFNQWSFP